MLVSYEDITAARSRIREKIHETPCFTSQQFQIKYCQGRNVFFKCDNLQKCGSFKIRGALNAVCKLVERDPMVEAVVTESSGNFGQALAYAARLCNLTCYVVCPTNTVQAKKDAAIGYGARVIECEPNEAARKEGAEKIQKETGATFVHPFAHEDVIAGQGTAGLEMIDQVPPEIDAVLVPLGGGGLTRYTIAYAARLCNLTCYVVCPTNTVQAKKDAATGYGAQVIECEPNEAARKEGAEKIQKETGATFVHPFAHEDVIAGQGTAGLEMIDQVPPEIDAVLVPLGGGGLTSGVAVAIKHVYPNAKIFGIEPETANDAHLSFTNKRLIPNATYPTTICDGLRTSLSDITLRHILQLVDDVILVPDRETAEAAKFVLSRMKLCVEPSGAIGVAALMNQENIDKYLGGCKNIVVMISGGNFDFLTQAHLIN